MNQLAPPPRDIARSFAALRAAQPGWAAAPVRERLAVLRRTRRLLAVEIRGLAEAASREAMSTADILVAEVMPLLAALRWLERRAEALLRERTPPGGRPIWLFGTRLLVRRVPFGVVLVLGPGNYPLLLPGVQALQALAAGNAVAIKPAPGRAAPMALLADALGRAGLPLGLCAVLPDTHSAGEAALGCAPDKVVLTGAEPTGRAVLARLAKSLTPCTLELSGHDAVIVLPGARLDLVARAIGYGLSLNGGETCIAPRRILAVGATHAALAQHLAEILPTWPARPLAPEIAEVVARAVERGGRIIGGEGPLVLDVPEADALLPPLFGPVASLLPVPNEAMAVALANAGPHALGAAVFGPARAARAVASQLRAGCVTVNDLIVPTADPRLPFGGAGASGFGATRGADGLLEMTRPQARVLRARPISGLYRRLPDSAVPWIARLLRALYA